MSKTVTVTAKVRYRRWIAPNFATQEVPPRPRQDGFQTAPTTAVRDLEPDTLDALAQAWLEDLYSKADRPAPRFAQ